MTMSLADVVSLLGWTLLDFVWQGVLIGALGAGVLGVLRNARPQARYAACCVLLAACVLVPALTLLGRLPGTEVAGALASGAGPAETYVGGIAQKLGWLEVSPWRAWLGEHLQPVVFAWCTGACVLLLRLGAGFSWVARVRSQAQAADSAWQSRLDTLAARVGVRRVCLRLSRNVDSPIVAGWWRPVVLIPTALTLRMPANLLEALLAHELAHIRRHDTLVNLAQNAVESLLFYHPVVWWLSRRIRLEREQIADDIAVEAIGDPRCLALALQQLDRLQAQPDDSFLSNHLATAANGGNLMKRIQRLLRPARQPLDWKLAAPVAVLAMACLGAAARDSVPAPAAPTPVSLSSTAPVATFMPAMASSTTLHAKRPQQSYALVRHGQESMTVSGDMADLAEIKRVRGKLHGDFLWFRDSGDAYVVQDAELLARATRAWQPAEVLGREMDVLGKEMEPHSKKMEALGGQMEALSKQSQPANKDMEAIGRKMEPLGRQQEAIGRKMQAVGDRMVQARNDEERQRLSAEMENLATQMQPLQAQMEVLARQMSAHSEKLQSQHQPMQALGAQMEQAGEPMKAIGEKMEVLGKKQEKISKAAELATLALIAEAKRDGKAVKFKP